MKHEASYTFAGIRCFFSAYIEPKAVGRDFRMKRKPKEAIVKGLSLPRDVIFGDFIITSTGNQEVFIENYRGILSYDDHKICIQGNHVTLKICGDNLTVDYYSQEAMKILGKIERLEYL